jgi:hypothetical protein
MYLDTGTLVATMIALTTSLTLMITTVLQNARLTKDKEYWYYQYMELKHYVEHE